MLPYRMPPLLTLVLILATACLGLVAGCDDDDPADPTGPMPPDGGGPGIDLTGLEGAWIVRTTGSQPQFFCPAGCEDRLADLIDTYFDLPAADSTCVVVVDSLRTLLLTEPFASEADCSGFADAQGTAATACVECEHEGFLLGDSLLTSIDVTLLTDNEGATFQADFTISTRTLAPGDPCGGCRALFGIGGIRRATADCP